MLTYIKPSWDKDEAFFIETWWLTTSRIWVTQVKDSNLNQIGESEMSPNKPCAVNTHKRTIAFLTEGYIPFIEQHFIK